MLAIACGYEDADDLDDLRIDPGFKLVCGHLPDTGDDLCSQPTTSRWENAPKCRLHRGMVSMATTPSGRSPHCRLPEPPNQTATVVLRRFRHR
jgi:Transposase DDE domain group 1